MFSILFNVNYLKIGKKKELCHLFKCKYWSEYQLSVADWSIWWWFIRFECIIYQLQNLKIRKIKYQYLAFDKKGIHMRDQWRISIIKCNKRRHQVMQVCKNIVNFVLSRCSNHTICLVNSKECSFLQAENSQKFVFYIVLFSSLDHLQCMRHHMGYEILGRHNIIAEHNYCVNWAYPN